MQGFKSPFFHHNGVCVMGIKDVFKKGAMISGAVIRAVIGVGASVFLFLTVKKKKGKR